MGGVRQTVDVGEYSVFQLFGAYFPGDDQGLPELVNGLVILALGLIHRPDVIEGGAFDSAAANVPMDDQGLLVLA